MSTLQIITWSLLMLLGFAGSALYSGLETGAYSLNTVRLQIYHHQRHRRALLLSRMLDDPTRLLTTLLIGNNIANYLGTAALAVLLDAAAFNDWQAVALNTLIVTPMLFVFGETLPKDLFAAFSDRLMYRLAPVLAWSQRVLTWVGLVPLIGVFTRWVMVALGQSGQVRPFHPRRRVEALVKEGVGYGLLSDDQSAMVQRILELGHRRLGDEMVPWNEVLRVTADDSPSRLWELADNTSHSRFPVVDSKGRVLGVVNVMEALQHPVEQCPPIIDLLRPPTLLAASTPLRQGLAELQRRHVALAIVTGPEGRPAGLVTIKDLVEAITGELTSW